VLSRMGAQITYQNNRMANNEPVADVTVQNRQLKSTVVQGSLVPMIIDEIPLLAVAGTQAEGKTIIKDAKELRFKETDRIAAVVHNLRSMGVQIDEQEDGFIVSGPQKLRGAVVDSFGDHRIAMSFAVAGLIAEGETTIKGAESAEISYPGFFETLRRLTHD
jgi:3-phosphoshikimate 1-carboxyvinyltransferase